jgi:acetyl esterase
MIRNILSQSVLSLLLLAAGSAFGADHDSGTDSGTVKTEGAGPVKKKPDIGNQKYGPSASHVLDLWQAKSDHPTPLLIYIHGGGFSGGDKNYATNGHLINECHQAGISVASINYRLSGEALAPAAQYDSARAVQFLRSKAKEWNLDPTRICLTGGSAGAGISLWIGFHDDLADPKSEDPIARESTRVTCIAPFNCQTTYDPRVIKTIVGSKTYKVPPLMKFFGIKDDALADSPTQELAKLFEEVSAVNYLSVDDPPVYIAYNAEVNGIHSVKFGLFLKEKMDALHIECVIRGPKTRQYEPEQMEFIKRHLLAAGTVRKVGGRNRPESVEGKD